MSGDAALFFVAADNDAIFQSLYLPHYRFSAANVALTKSSSC
jgi:hypothetical protein